MDIVESIRRLKPARVLDANGSVAARLRSGSVAVDIGGPASGRYDLVVWLDPDGAPQSISQWTAITDAVLFSTSDADLPRALETFLAAGFVPDLSYRGDAVLVRRAEPPSERELALLLAEVLRHRASAAGSAALEHRVEYLHAIVEDLRRQTASLAGSRTWRILTGAGGLILRRAVRKLIPRRHCGGAPSPERYHRWISEYERREPAPDGRGPRITIVAPDERTMASLAAQPYGNWDTAPSVEAAGGDYLIWPAAGDELAPDALQAFANAARAGTGLIYSDEDLLDSRGVRANPDFKPDWSPDLLLARNYTGRAMMFRPGLAAGASGPHEIALRAAADAAPVVHVPKVLYHRRTSLEPARRDVLERYLPAGTAVEDGRVPGSWRVRYPVPAGLRVDIIVPSRNPALLQRCLESVRARTEYSGYGFTVIDNSEAGLHAAAERFGARMVDWRGRAFNYSAMNNEAALGSSAPLLLFLNDDTTPIDPGWLTALVELAARPEVGAVGARLLYPDGTIQHAGVVIGIFGVCGHAFKGCPGAQASYGGYADVIRNVSAVTGACLMVRAEVFREAGGFDAEHFPVAYNDIDLCLRIGRAGRRVLYTPHASLYHHEAKSKPWRQREPSRAEVRAFQERWRDWIDHDPFYNPNLTRSDETYGLRSRAWES